MAQSTRSSSVTGSKLAPGLKSIEDAIEIRRERRCQPLGVALTARQSAEHPDHLQDLGDRPLVEGDDGEAASDQLGRRVGLQIGEGQHQIRLQSRDLVEPCVDERRDLAADQLVPVLLSE